MDSERPWLVPASASLNWYGAHWPISHHHRRTVNALDTMRALASNGEVVTVEPGLYYPGLGGVRLEDVALVTQNGARNLTRFEKQLEI